MCKFLTSVILIYRYTTCLFQARTPKSTYKSTTTKSSEIRGMQIQRNRYARMTL